MEIIAQQTNANNNNMETETTTAEAQLELELKQEQDLLLAPEQKQHNNHNQLNLGLNFQACDASSDPASTPEKKLDDMFDSMMASMCSRSNWKAEVDSETETVTDIQIKTGSGDKPQPPAMEAALKWKSHLDHVENRLFEFEKEIQEHEATLASTLSSCELLLEKLSQVPDPGPNSNPNSTDPQADGDDDGSEGSEGVGAVDDLHLLKSTHNTDITETEEVVLNIWKNQKRSQSQSRSPRIFTSTFAAPDSGRSSLETSDLAAGENHPKTQPGGKILCESCGSLFKNVSDYNTHFEKCGAEKNHYDETDKDHSQQ